MKTLLELLSPAAAVENVAFFLLMLHFTVNLISIVHPPVSCRGLSREYFAFLILVNITVVHRNGLCREGHTRKNSQNMERAEEPFSD